MDSIDLVKQGTCALRASSTFRTPESVLEMQQISNSPPRWWCRNLSSLAQPTKNRLDRIKAFAPSSPVALPPTRQAACPPPNPLSNFPMHKASPCGMGRLTEASSILGRYLGKAMPFLRRSCGIRAKKRVVVRLLDGSDHVQKTARPSNREPVPFCEYSAQIADKAIKCSLLLVATRLLPRRHASVRFREQSGSGNQRIPMLERLRMFLICRPPYQEMVLLSMGEAVWLPEFR
jgi:hypothetical protein